MQKVDVMEKVSKYETFINEVLREDLRKLEYRLQAVNAEVNDLVQQKQSLKILTDKTQHPKGFKTQLNVGCNFFMEASVPDTSTLLFHVGLNHYLEFTVDEANKYLDARIKAYENKAEELRTNTAQTKAHIKMMLLGIGELQNKFNNIS